MRSKSPHAIEWGRRIRHRRLELGQEQIWLATQVGVHQATVSNWETGQSAPSDVYRARIAQALQISAADLFSYPTNGEAA